MLASIGLKIEPTMAQIKFTARLVKPLFGAGGGSVAGAVKTGVICSYSSRLEKGVARL